MLVYCHKKAAAESCVDGNEQATGFVGLRAHLAGEMLMFAVVSDKKKIDAHHQFIFIFILLHHTLTIFIYLIPHFNPQNMSSYCFSSHFIVTSIQEHFYAIFP